MAISCEKVYSGTGDQIYPETADKAVTVLAANTTLDIYLADLSKKISNMQGADQIAKSLKFKIDYLATSSTPYFSEIYLARSAKYRSSVVFLARTVTALSAVSG